MLCIRLFSIGRPDDTLGFGLTLVLLTIFEAPVPPRALLALTADYIEAWRVNSFDWVDFTIEVS